MPDMMKPTGESLRKRFDTLDSQRANNKQHWQECAFYFLPPRAYITGPRTSGEKFAPDLYQSAGQLAAQVFAAGIMGYLSNPSSRWFALETRERALMEVADVKRWFHDVEEIMYGTFDQSNFYSSVHQHYLDLGVFGTPCLYEETDPKDIIRFYSRPIEEYCIAEDETGRVDTLFRKFRITARQAILKWGEDAVSDDIKKAYKKNEDKMFDFLHGVFPRYDYEVGKEDAVNLPVASFYVEYSKKRILNEGGYHEFPFFVPRYGTLSGEPWAYSPAMLALADMKQTNRQEWTITKAGQKMVSPTIILPHTGYLLPFKTGPDAVNYKLQGTPNDKIETIGVNGKIPLGIDMIERKIATIERQFFNDLFLLLAQHKNMTATEVIERVSEKMLILGPVVGRLISELLDPLIIRTFNILFREGLLPPPPPILEGREWQPNYISPLAKAQRIQEVNSMANFLALTGQIAQTLPDVLDKINADQVIDEAADLYGVTPEIIRSDDEVQGIREARAAQQQQLEQMAQLEQVAGIAKTASEADKNNRKDVKKNGK